MVAAYITCFAIFNIFDNGKSIPLIYYFKNLSTGIVEEVLFRSICFGLLIYLIKLKNKTNYIFTAALISSFAFGAVHILNLIGNPSSIELLLSTTFQVFYAIFIGLGFAGHTFKNNSILIPILVHTLIDLFNDDNLLSNNITQKSSLPLLVSVCVIGIPYIIYGIKILMDTRIKHFKNGSINVKN